MKRIPILVDSMQTGAAELTECFESQVANALAHGVELVLGGVVAVSHANTNDRPQLLSLTLSARAMPTFNPSESPKLMQDMTEPELSAHVSRQMRFIKSCQTPDTIGSILLIFQKDGCTQYGATVDPETVPQALRELADRIERRQTVKR